jgi:ElaB/YqjD/DUF883 family membrane-anchored ribosome-binding protein
MDNTTESGSIGMEEVTKEKLVTDLKTVAHDAEELLKATAGELGDKTKEARAKLASALEKAKASYQKIQEKASEGVKATDQCIRTHPYQALGIAFGVGVIIGLLAKRK